MASDGEGIVMADSGDGGGESARKILVSPQEERFLRYWRDFWWNERQLDYRGQGTFYRLTENALGEVAMAEWHQRQLAEVEEQARYAPIYRESSASRISDALPGMLMGELVGDATGLSAVEGVDFGRSSSFAQLTLFSVEALVSLRIWADVNSKWADRGNFRPAEFLALAMWWHAQGVPWAEIMTGKRAAHFPRPVGWLADQPEMRFSVHPDEAALEALRDFAVGSRKSITAANDSRAAGVLASSVPLALWCDVPEELVKIARGNASLTHGAPQAQCSAAALAVLCNALLNNRDLREAVRRAIESVRQTEGAADTVRALEYALAAAEGTAVQQFAAVFGEVSDADAVLAVATYAAMAHRDDFERAVAEAAGVPGNRPAVAGVCGALVGMASGVDAIPAARLNALAVGGVARRLIDDARIEFASAHPPRTQEWLDRYDYVRGSEGGR